jgi:hypothetical protein
MYKEKKIAMILKIPGEKHVHNKDAKVINITKAGKKESMVLRNVMGF